MVNPATQGAREVFGRLTVGSSTTDVVVALPATTDQQGLVVRDPSMDDVVTALNAVLEELRKVTMHLNILTELERS